MRFIGLLISLVVVSCHGPPTHVPPPDAAIQQVQDKRPPDHGRPDIFFPEVVPSDPRPAPGLTEVLLKDGSRRTGHLVATYDHRRWWWNPADELTYALFWSNDFSAYPEDQSFTFLSSVDIELISWGQPQATSPYFREFMRQYGFLCYRVPLEGVAYVITGNDSYHLSEDGYGDFAWDLVRTDEQGHTFADGGLENEDYFVWDSPVFLPHTGYVVEVVRDAEDNTPGSYPDDAINNMVGIHMEGSYYLYLLHFKQHSIPSSLDQTCEPYVPDTPCVEPGAILKAGTFIGRVGNSGVSLVPHLHLSFLWWDADAATPRYWSIPGEFSGIHHATAPEGPAIRVQYSVPGTGEWISSDPF